MITRGLFNLPYFGGRNPLLEMELMKRRMDAFTDLIFRDSPTGREIHAGVFPLINLTEDSDNYYLRAELPGMKAEDIDIQAVGNNLTISGERKIPSEGDNVRYHRSEREAGKFSRAFSLPGEIDVNKVSAKMTNGLLRVELPKAEKAKPRQISIN